MNFKDIPYRSPKELDAWLLRAQQEGWTELALGQYSRSSSSRFDDWFEVDPEHCFQVSGHLTVSHSLLQRFGRLNKLAMVACGINTQGASALASLTELTSLCLRSNNIGTEGACTLVALTGLTSLDLGNNGIGTDGACALASLSGLASLDLANNAIGDKGVRALASLTGLTSLDVGNNGIGPDGASALASLSRLTSLRIANNKIGDKGVRWLAPLVRLTSLTLQENGVMDEGLTALASLSGLVRLDLSNNRIGNPGLRTLAVAWQNGAWSGLRFLDLRQNRITTVENATLETCDPRQIFEAVLRGQALREVRVMFVGMGNVGKSWLFRRCFLDEVVDLAEERRSTHDLDLIHPEVCQWKPTLQLGRSDVVVEPRVWDFAGQLVTHGVHEAFLPSDGRTVYVVVLNATRVSEIGAGRTDHNSGNRLSYWLRTIRHFAGSDVPVVICITQCDRYDDGSIRPVDDGTDPVYQRIADSFWETHGVSVVRVVDGCSATSSDHNISPLRDALELATSTLSAVREGKVHPKLPALKRRVEQELSLRTTASVDEFCTWADDVEIEGRDFQESFLRTLHFMGTLFHFGHTRHNRDHFHPDREQLPRGYRELLETASENDPALRDTIFNPVWLKYCVYEIVRQSESSKHQGWFRLDEIEGFVDQALKVMLSSRQAAFAITPGDRTPSEKQRKATPQERDAIRSFLKLVQLCWFDKAHGLYLFPRGLAEGTPDNSGRWPVSKLCWEFLPEANFHRLMVHLHAAGQVVRQDGTWKHWRYSVLIHHPYCDATQAAVVTFPEEGRVEVRFHPDGNSDLWPELLSSIRHFLEVTVRQGRTKEPVVVPATGKKSAVTGSSSGSTPDELADEDKQRVKDAIGLLEKTGKPVSDAVRVWVRQLFVESLRLKTPKQQISFRAAYFFTTIMRKVVPQLQIDWTRIYDNCPWPTFGDDRHQSKSADGLRKIVEREGQDIARHLDDWYRNLPNAGND